MCNFHGMDYQDVQELSKKQKTLHQNFVVVPRADVRPLERTLTEAMALDPFLWSLEPWFLKFKLWWQRLVSSSGLSGCSNKSVREVRNLPRILFLFFIKMSCWTLIKLHFLRNESRLINIHSLSFQNRFSSNTKKPREDFWETHHHPRLLVVVLKIKLWILVPFYSFEVETH